MKNLYNQQTRVAIVGENSDFVFDLVSYILSFSQKPIDLVKFDEVITHQKNDFVLMALDAKSEQFLNFEPTIVLLTDFSSSYPHFLNTITSGGILIYNEEIEEIKEAIQSAEKYFRKIPFQTPVYSMQNSTLLLSTDLGVLSASVEEKYAPLVEASQLLCQQLGIQEEEFYEALMNY